MVKQTFRHNREEHGGDETEPQLSPGRCPACDDQLDMTVQQRLTMLYSLLANRTYQIRSLQNALESGVKRHDEEMLNRDVEVLKNLSLAQSSMGREREATRSEIRLRSALERLVGDLVDQPAIVERIREALDGHEEIA